MFTHETSFRVRYSETDKMGFVYYGNYAAYFEVGRVEALRSLGISYKELEDMGVMLPVLEFKTKYLKPAYYDDTLLLVTKIPELPKARIRFEYELYNAKKELLTIAETTLVFVDIKSAKPCPAPQHVIEALQKKF
jgi:acyl-CoA thioester hydrolase